MAQEGINYVSGVAAQDLFAREQFDAAFLPLWFWTDNTVAETYQQTLTQVSPSTKVVIMTDDAHAERSARLAAASEQLAATKYTSEKIADIASRESEHYQNADLVLTVSEEDANTIARSAAGTPVQTVHFASPRTVKTSATVAPFESRQGVSFVGYGGNPTNKLGLEWFFEEVYPLLPEDMKTVQFTLIGSTPQDNFESLRATGANIVALGSVSDERMRELVSASRVMIAPIVASTGVNTKAYVGLSTGTPVVATSVAAAGLRWSSMAEQHAAALITADSEQAFADALVAAYTKPSLWATTSSTGHAMAAQQVASGQFSSDLKTALNTLNQAAPKARVFSNNYISSSELAAREAAGKLGASLQGNCGSGDDCPIVDCTTVHCFNGGTCVDHAGADSTCTCDPNSGYTGQYCDQDIDECSTHTAQCVHGTCQNTAGGYTCDCTGTGYQGTFCQTASSCAGDSTTKPSNGNANTCANTGSYQGTCSVACNTGYNPSGTATRTCQADGTWSALSSGFTCTAVTCAADSTAPSNGNANTCGQLGTFGTSTAQCTLACNTGYTQSGTATRTCGSNGQWTAVALTCTAVTCAADSSAPSNGNANTCGQLGTFGTSTASCSVACNTGYTASGTATRTCGSNGQWTAVALTCTAVTCAADSTAPSNGNANTCGHLGTFGTSSAQCSLACNTGYTPSGSATRTCGSNGQWTAVALSCSPVTCAGDAVTAPTNGNANGCASSGSYQGTCNVACNTGYVPSGSAQRTCGANGQWSAVALQCSPVTCAGDSVTAPANGNAGTCANAGSFGSSGCAVACNTGYVGSGTATRTCGSNGAWSTLSSGFTCTAVTCAASTTAPTNGAVGSCNAVGTYGQSSGTCAVTCNTGYTASGLATRTCTSSGAWSAIDSTFACSPNACAADSTIPAGGAVGSCGTAGTYQGTCTIQCATGYTPSGSGLRTCQANGVWTSPSLTCTIVTCAADSTTKPANGNAGTCVSSGTYGSTCYVACNTGYSNAGTAARTCQASGSWSAISSTMQCNSCSVSIGNSNGPTTTTGNQLTTAAKSLVSATTPQLVINAGSSVYVLVQVADSKSVSIVGDNFGNSYTRATYKANGSIRAEIWYKDNVAAMSGLVVTATLTDSAHATIEVVELRGTANPSLDSNSVTGTTGSASTVSLSITSSTAGAMLLMSVGSPNNQHQSFVAGSLGSIISASVQPSASGQDIAGAAVNYLVAGAGTYSPNVIGMNYANTVAGTAYSSQWAAVGVAVKAGCVTTCPADTTAPTNGAVGTCGSVGVYGQTSGTCAVACASGYVAASGTSGTRTCGSNGVWSTATLTCSPISCAASSTAPTHGTYGTCNAAATYGSTCAVTCSAGYYVTSGTATRTCGVGATATSTAGAWSTMTAVCSACPSGFAGDNCATNINDCVSGACSNGDCVDGVNTYTCSCYPGYSGAKCQTNINDCTSTSCNGHGTCTDGVNSVSCTCQTGWYGASCSQTTPINCHWIGPAGSGTDSWCNTNCNRATPYCPTSQCSCDAALPAHGYIGCSDGTREAFTDRNNFQLIAGCAGGWTVPGVQVEQDLTPQCNRNAGNTGTLSSGCGAADLCEEGWHVCASPIDVANSVGSNAGCSATTDWPANSFFTTRTSGNGAGNCNMDGEWANDVFGCGTDGCAIFSSATGCTGLNMFSHNACSYLKYGWSCPDNTGGWNEANNIVHTGNSGGVLCCKDNAAVTPSNVLQAGPLCDNSPASLVCPAGTTVNVLTAQYGRQDGNICTIENGVGTSTVTNCKATDPLSATIALCKNKQSCSFTVNMANLNAGVDPCPGTHKYFEATYDCVYPDGSLITPPVQTAQPTIASGISAPTSSTSALNSWGPICEGNAVTLYCPTGYVIKTDNVFYGRSSTSVCQTAYMSDTSCTLSNAEPLVAASCDGQQICQVWASNAEFGAGDPCSGTTKYMTGGYYCTPNLSNSWKMAICQAPGTAQQTQLYIDPSTLSTYLTAGAFVGTCTAMKTITVTLDVDFSSIPDITTFLNTVLADLYAAAGVNPSIGVFFVSSWKSGSMILDIDVVPQPYEDDPVAPTDPALIVANLQSQMAEPTSVYNQGVYTSKTTDMTVTDNTVSTDNSNSSSNSTRSMHIGVGVAAGVIGLALIALIALKCSTGRRRGAKVVDTNSFDATVPSASAAANVPRAAKDDLAVPVAEAEPLWTLDRNAAAAGAAPAAQ